MCDPKGRDCIEENSLSTFDCNSTCVGIYADIQFVKKSMKDELKVEETEGQSRTEFKEKDEGTDLLLQRLAKLENVSHGEDMKFKEKFEEASSMWLKRFADLGNEVKLLRSGVAQQINDELLKRGAGENGKELDKEKYNVLIAEYMRFKTKHVKHFRFNSAGNSSAFGETIFKL